MTHADARLAGTGFPGSGVLASALANRWWVMLLRGGAAIAFGVLAFRWPGLTLLTLTFFWAVFAIVDGALALVGAIFGGRRHMAARWWLAVIGCIGILAGGTAIVAPIAAATVLVMFIGGWAIVTGALQIWGALRLRHEIKGEFLLMLGGLLSAVIGVILLARPLASGLTVVWLVSIFAVLLGIAYIALGIRLRAFKGANQAA